ncbi:MAG: tail fiber protein [Proteobacteria bacterium]|nr:tail fiber protein [Pseudomonadota bacterium]NBP13554.1 tail fiber protein [bacterium]
MGLLDKLKGFVKLSEVSVDSAQPLFDTQIREDANTALTQSTLVLDDTLRKQGMVVTSTGIVSWALNKLSLDANVNIVLKFLQNQSGQVTNLVLNYSDFVSGLSFPNDGDILYIELDRAKITGTNVTIYNGGLNVGQRAVIASSLPALANSQLGSFQGTICIPIAVRQGLNLWWNPSGIYWSPGTSGVIGSIGTTDPIPTGTILTFAGQEADVPAGYLFCNGNPKSAALYPALASLYWNGTTYLYGGDSFVPGPTPNGNFNLPDLRGLFIKGAGIYGQDGLNPTGQFLNGKKYSATLADKQPDRTAVNNLTTGNGGYHRHRHFNDVSGEYGGLGGPTGGIEMGGSQSVWSYNNPTPRYFSTDPDHIHSISSTDQQTHPGHIGLNYIIKA